MNLRFLRAGLAALALVTLAACGSSDSDAGDGGWTYTDDLGNTIELDAAPERIVAQVSLAAALEDLGVEVVGYFGPTTDPDGEPDAQAGDLDAASLEDVTGGGEYGDLDLEALAGLRPDLVVTWSYVEPDLWYINEATAEKFRDQFPIAVQSLQDKTLIENLDATEKLAEALGADLDSAEVKQAHADFEAAADRLRDIGEKLGDRTILAGSALPEQFYASNPDVSSDLKYYRDELGLPLIVPDNPDPQGGYFESLSWENADKYDADIFLWDARIGDSGIKLIDEQPTWATTKAGQNDAYVPWYSVAPTSYAAHAQLMNDLADGLEKYL